MDSFRQTKRNCQLASRPSGNIYNPKRKEQASQLEERTPPRVELDRKSEIEDLIDTLLPLINAVRSVSAPSSRNVSLNSSVDLFDEPENEEAALNKQNEEIEQRIRSLQLKKRQIIETNEKIRAESIEQEALDAKTKEKLKLKIAKLEKKNKALIEEKSNLIEDTLFYEPLFKLLKINPKNPTCAEGKPIVLPENSTAEQQCCEYWNCPSQCEELQLKR